MLTNPTRDLEEGLLLKLVRPVEGEQESTSHQEEPRGRHGLLPSGLKDVIRRGSVSKVRSRYGTKTPCEVTLRLCRQDSGKEAIWPMTI